MSVVQARPSWFRQRNEPLPAYEAFKLYRGTLDADDDDTSPVLQKRQRKHHETDEYIDATWTSSKPLRDLHQVSRFTHKSYLTIRQYSSKYKWRDRAYDYDTFVSERIRDAIEANVALKVSRFLQVRDREAERRMELSEILEAKAKVIAAQVIEENLWQSTDEVEEFYPDGRPMTITRIYRPANWRVSDLALLANSSAELMDDALALALGESKPGTPPEEAIPADLAAAALLAIEAKAAQMKGLEHNGDADGPGDGPA
jgi:hypothetical protein